VLVLSGEHDGYSPPEDVRRFASAFPSATVHVLEGTDHYLWRREREAASVVGGFVDGVLAQI
jgi:pimeloyl-ACP methyl ester carboxylesterase